MHTNIRKRIFINEWEELQEKYNDIKVHIQSDTTTLNLILSSPKKREPNTLPKTIRFELTKEYPFTAPKVFVENPYNKNNLDYLFLRTIYCCQIKTITEKLRKVQDNYCSYCIYCNFITNNWSPALRMSSIVNEIEHLQKIKRKIKYEIAIERLSERYNIPPEIGNIIILFLCTF